MHHLVRVSLTTVAFMLFFLAGPGIAGAACPTVVFSLAPDGNQYVGAFHSRQRFTGKADATLYTAGASYEIAGVSVDTPIRLRIGGTGSEAFVLQQRPADPYTAMVTTFTSVDGSMCVNKAVLPVKYEPNGDYKELEKATTANPAVITLAPVFAASQTPLPCAQPFVDASTIKPVSPDYPLIARYGHQSGTVRVRVTLAADGTVAAATIYNSSGFDALDDAAVAAAKASVYKAEVFRCEPTGGDYLFTADFEARRR